MSQDRRAVLAVGATFAVNGLAYAAFVARLPQVADRLDLGPGALGLVLLWMSVGALASAFAGRWVIPAVGARRVAVGGGVLVAGSVACLGLAPSAPLLAAALALLGVADALQDAAMNDLGAVQEQRAGRSLMGRLHATWGAAGAVGAGVGAGAAALAVPVGLHLPLWGAVLLALQLSVARSLPRPAPAPGTGDPANGVHADPADGAAVAGRRRARWLPWLLLAACTVAGALVEEVPTDWSALQLREVADAAPGVAGLGPTLFLAALLAGRLAHDPLVDRVGAARTALLAAAVGALGGTAGLVLADVLASPVAGVVGWACVGLGAAPAFPLLFSASARLPGGASGVGTSVVSGSSRLGFLAGPVLVGQGAEVAGLGVAVLLGPAAALVTGLGLVRLVAAPGPQRTRAPRSRSAGPPGGQ